MRNIMKKLIFVLLALSMLAVGGCAGVGTGGSQNQGVNLKGKEFAPVS